MSYSVDQVRALLAQNAALREQARQTDSRIRQGAEMEIARIDAQIESLRGPAYSDSMRAHQYQELIRRRAQLLRVIA